MEPESDLQTEATGLFHILCLRSCLDFVRERRARDISHGNGLNTHAVNSCAHDRYYINYILLFKETQIFKLFL